MRHSGSCIIYNNLIQKPRSCPRRRQGPFRPRRIPILMGARTWRQRWPSSLQNPRMISRILPCRSAVGFSSQKTIGKISGESHQCPTPQSIHYYRPQPPLFQGRIIRGFIYPIYEKPQQNSLPYRPPGSQNKPI